ncbi:unnamed protein product [Coregonus sp. 'balchen']|nr:unnamed protein product [Coregonus sp. 'balchen']
MSNRTVCREASHAGSWYTASGRELNRGMGQRPGEQTCLSLLSLLQPSEQTCLSLLSLCSSPVNRPPSEQTCLSLLSLLQPSEQTCLSLLSLLQPSEQTCLSLLSLLQPSEQTCLSLLSLLQPSEPDLSLPVISLLQPSEQTCLSLLSLLQPSEQTSPVNIPVSPLLSLLQPSEQTCLSLLSLLQPSEQTCLSEQTLSLLYLCSSPVNRPVSPCYLCSQPIEQTCILLLSAQPQRTDLSLPVISLAPAQSNRPVSPCYLSAPAQRTDLSLPVISLLQPSEQTPSEQTCLSLLSLCSSPVNPKVLAHEASRRRVFILGPSHHVPLSRCALSSAEVYKTPLYDLRIDQKGMYTPRYTVPCPLLKVYADLWKTGMFERMSLQTDEDEHSIEMHLPYTAKAMESHKDELSIVPVLVGALSESKEQDYGKLLSRYLADPSNLFIISSDFCHWGQRFRYTYYDEAQGEIHRSIEHLDKMVNNTF